MAWPRLHPRPTRSHPADSVDPPQPDYPRVFLFVLGPLFILFGWLLPLPKNAASLPSHFSIFRRFVSTPFMSFSTTVPLNLCGLSLFRRERKKKKRGKKRTPPALWPEAPGGTTAPPMTSHLATIHFCSTAIQIPFGRELSIRGST
ncbi:hypothetical protein Salat_1068600 [Sesamum alatum]|uniref:Uncharacterized protein n=1 Tax=Sesamum alatum TaxID=300844 RepID=A0AAE1YME9_9LAMI|nr:hypothetical protein Salat_1068600 [Sesamum alatum]